MPARIDKAYWNGEHSSSKCELNCLANALATRRRNEHPVAMPPTPPSFFESAVNCALVKADAMELGTFACAKLLAASNNSSRVSSSSIMILRCSKVHPLGLEKNRVGLS